jgi:hypothetical protein
MRFDVSPPRAIRLAYRTLDGTPMGASKGFVWRWYLLLAVEFIGMLWVPFYNAVEPKLWGVPFFYWYQLAGIIIGAALTAIVYFATREVER